MISAECPEITPADKEEKLQGVTTGREAASEINSDAAVLSEPDGFFTFRGKQSPTPTASLTGP